MGDSADGFPGLKGWGKKGAATVLLHYPHLEDIPEHGWRWTVDVRGANALSATFNAERDLAFLFRDLATLRADAPVLEVVDDIRWAGPAVDLEELATRLDAPRLVERVAKLTRR